MNLKETNHIKIVNETNKNWFIHQQSIPELKEFYKIPSQRWISLNLKKNRKNLTLRVGNNFIELAENKSGIRPIEKLKITKRKPKPIVCVSCKRVLWSDVYREFPHKKSYMLSPKDKVVCSNCCDIYNPKKGERVTIFDLVFNQFFTVS